MNKKMIKSIFQVGVGNIFILLAGLITGFVVPKVLGINDYGYYKIFTLYCSYVSILHFGFIDGIYLKYGNIGNNNLEKNKFQLITYFLFVLEILVSVIVGIISIFMLKDFYYKIIFVFVAMNICGINCTTYFQILSQITQNFKELTIRNIIKSILQILSIMVLLGICKYYSCEISFYVYIFVYTLISYILLLWYVITYKNIIKVFSLKVLYNNRKELFEYFKIGIPLTLSNMVTILLLSLDRQFVNYLFHTDEFAVYSFAYSLLTILTTIISAIAVVLYPYLKTNPNDIDIYAYEKNSTMVIIIASAFSLLYVPLSYFIYWFLPDYYMSIKILLIMIPTIIISSTISIVCHNYYKVFNRAKEYFHLSILALIIAFIMNVLLYILLKNIYSIAIASLITMYLWFLLVDIKLFKKKKRIFKLWLYKNCYILCLCACFVYLFYEITIKKYLIYLIIYFLISIIYYKKTNFEALKERSKNEKE